MRQEVRGDRQRCDQEGNGSRSGAVPAFGTAVPCALVELYLANPIVARRGDVEGLRD